ncbi:DUF2834 domain-containing protein [Bacillus salacetis]|uniref:DUF2834 domain-containing protein n=1 Tax=Bacillus salacetis TaxID=2315464 RepID=UPI001F0BBE60|nr:DUF2834 domain-containing protein [Bacillus salacetis]
MAGENVLEKDGKWNPLKSPQVLLVFVIGLFGILTGLAVYQHGLLGIFAQAFSNSASLQVFADLFISLILVLVWMWYDARKSNRFFWPWAFLTLGIGVFGPLLYLLFRRQAQG